MIPIWTVYICAVVFLVTGALELLSVKNGTEGLLFPRALCAFGFWMFGTRIMYLAWSEDVSRLHFASMSALMAICIGRIIICTGIMRKK